MGALYSVEKEVKQLKQRTQRKKRKKKNFCQALVPSLAVFA